MQFVPIIGGRAWEWEHGGLKYYAVSLNGSASVYVYTTKSDDSEDWTFAFERLTNGQPAENVVEHIYHEVTEIRQ